MVQSSPRPSLVRSRKFYIGVILVAALVLSSWYGASYYLGQLYPANNVSNRAGIINVLVNYGNGRSQWYNSTQVPQGWALYNVTASVTRLDAGYSTEYHAHFINSINGFPAIIDPSSTSYWALWIYCSKDRAWMYSKWGVDLIKPTSNGVSIQNSLGNPIFLSSNAFAWNYQSGGAESGPPVSGATKVDFCSS